MSAVFLPCLVFLMSAVPRWNRLSSFYTYIIRFMTCVVLQASFQQAAASDEKTDLVSRFLSHLGDELLRDTDWQAADDHQLFLAREAIEQMVMAKVSFSPRSAERPAALPADGGR